MLALWKILAIGAMGQWLSTYPLHRRPLGTESQVINYSLVLIVEKAVSRTYANYVQLQAWWSKILILNVSANREPDRHSNVVLPL